jgi:hypothetical protein
MIMEENTPRVLETRRLRRIFGLKHTFIQYSV